MKTEYEFAKAVREMLDEDVLPNIRNNCCDLERINSIVIRCDEIIEEHNKIKDDENEIR